VRASRVSLVVLAVAGAAVATAAVALIDALGYPAGYPWSQTAADNAATVATGVAWLAAGVIGLWLRPGARVGALMLAVGFATFAPVLVSAGGAPGFTLSIATEGLALAVAAHLFVAFPDGRVRGAGQRLLVAAAYLAAVLLPAVEWLFRDPADVGCVRCPENVLLVAPSAAAANAMIVAVDVVAIAIAVAIAVILARRWFAATGPARRVLAPVLWTSVAAALLFALGSLVEALHGFADPSRAVWWASLAGLTAIPAAFLAGLLRMRMHRSVVADLVVDLGRAPSPARTRDILARALGDPTLEIVFWVPDAQRYVDACGQPVALEQASARRATSVLRRDGEPLAALSYDASLREDPKLIEAVATAARLSLENARLQADLRAQLLEVRASRARIVAADDAARRRFERDLHDGAQHRLVSLLLNMQLARRGCDVGGAGPLLDEVERELGETLHELRALAAGLLPPALAEYGLEAAVGELAGRLPLRVDVAELPSARLPEPVEVAAYFLVAEALTNAAKHAGASVATVRVRAGGGRVRVEVGDDGVGGASEDGGSGLRGLADRLAALDGRLTVSSPLGGGTRVLAEVPCAS
jgi:signal transduction histidine kinase